MQDAIASAKSEFQRAKDWLVRTFEATPDDRLNWSPSAEARTPVALVAHSAAALKHMHDMLDGRTIGIPTMAEADVFFRSEEEQHKTRAAVLEMLENNSGAYVAWLDTLDAERLPTMIDLPFSMGQTTLAAGLTFVPSHLMWHTAQLQYLQTIYGDHVWH